MWTILVIQVQCGKTFLRLKIKNKIKKLDAWAKFSNIQDFFPIEMELLYEMEAGVFTGRFERSREQKWLIYWSYYDESHTMIYCAFQISDM